MAFLNGFTDTLQTDGYVVHDIFAKFEKIELHGCCEHARQYFHKTKKNQPNLANHALHLIQNIYVVVRELWDEGVSFESCARVRQEESVLILDELKIYLETHPVIPECPWHVAVNYSLNRWDRLTRFTENSTVEIDNNFAENRIRPVAPGVYSINYADWLEDMLEADFENPRELLYMLLHLHWKANQKATLAEAAWIPCQQASTHCVCESYMSICDSRTDTEPLPE